MGESLTQIAAKIRGMKHRTKAVEEKESDVKVQLIYAFNGVGKTRLSGEFKKLIAPKDDNYEEADHFTKYLYYNAFTEDLFYWDNDLEGDNERKLKIHPNAFTEWVLKEQGQDGNIVSYFQHYTTTKLTPRFNENFNEVTFSLAPGDNDIIENIKISKGEESNFVWCVFYSLLNQIVDVLNVAEPSDRETDKFNSLEYVFIDDPVSSLDENHLIELAVDLATLIKSSQSGLKFIITTHNPLFYNVLHNELKKSEFKKYILKKLDSGEYELQAQSNDSPFAYHLYLKTELEKAIASGELSKYHFNFLRNILEKTSTYLGYNAWADLLPESTPGERDLYKTRIINISSHSKHATEEVAELSTQDKNVLKYLLENTEILKLFK